MKILAALDNSDYSFKALRKAVDMANKENAELTIYTAYSILSDVGEVASMLMLATIIFKRGCNDKH
jgi:nucleotide-binding universal stress UspA family protein